MTERELEYMPQPQDPFSKWMLGLSASVVLAIGSALFTTTLGLREDMAVIRTELVTMKTMMTKLDNLQTQVRDHEYRIQWIERGSADHTSTTSTYQDRETVDSVRRIRAIP